MLLRINMTLLRPPSPMASARLRKGHASEADMMTKKIARQRRAVMFEMCHSKGSEVA